MFDVVAGLEVPIPLKSSELMGSAGWRRSSRKLLYLMEAMADRLPIGSFHAAGRRALKRCIRYWGLIGLLMPMVLLLLARVQGGEWLWPYVTLALWPSVVLPTAIDVIPNTTLIIHVTSLTLSLVMNACLYALVGGTLFWSYRGLLRLLRLRHS
ncbi:MAG: hypothetical protein ACE5NA_03165 [Nitrospiraceae bacterium]